MVGPAAIAHVANLDLDVLADFWPSAVLVAFASLLLDLLMFVIKQPVNLWLTKTIERFSNSLDPLLLELLTLLDDSLLVDVVDVDVVKIPDLVVIDLIGIRLVICSDLTGGLVQLLALFLKLFFQIFLLLAGEALEVGLWDV